MKEDELKNMLAQAITAKEEALRRLEEAKRSAEEVKATSEAMVRKSEEELTQATAQVNEARSATASAKSELDNAIKVYNSTISQINDTIQRLNTCYGDISLCDAQIAQKQAELDGYRGMLNKNPFVKGERQQTDIHAKIQKAEAELAKMRAWRMKLCQLGRKLEAHLRNLQQKSERYEKAIAEANTKFKLAEAKLNECTEVEKKAKDALEASKSLAETNIAAAQQKEQEAQQDFDKANYLVQYYTAMVNSALFHLTNYCRD